MKYTDLSIKDKKDGVTCKNVWMKYTKINYLPFF